MAEIDPPALFQGQQQPLEQLEQYGQQSQPQRTRPSENDGWEQNEDEDDGFYSEDIDLNDLEDELNDYDGWDNATGGTSLPSLSYIRVSINLNRRPPQYMSQGVHKSL